MSAGQYGLATNRYGAARQVTLKFDSREEAERIAAQMPPGVVLCKFDGQYWRAVR